MDIKTLRASRNADFSKLTAELEKETQPSGGKSFEDNRFWKPERDKAGNATATIRFLNRTEGDELPWIKMFSHAFKGPTGRWYIENSLTTIGQPDPCGELNSTLWNSTTDDNSPARKQARAQKRKLTYYANVLIVNDPKHPEHNGTVKIFKFGKKIFDKIMDKARPTFEDEDPVNVFDYWEGANFKLRMKTVDGYPNYDSSEFEAPSALADDDEEILEIVKKQHRLSEFLEPKNFKSYDELKAKLNAVLSGSSVTTTTAQQMAESDDPPFDAPTRRVEPKSTPAPAPRQAVPVADEDDSDLMDYFQSLASDD